MDVDSISKQAMPLAGQPSPGGGAAVSTGDQPSTDASASNSAEDGGKSPEPVISPVIAMDVNSNAMVLKFQEASGVTFQLPTRTTLEQRTHEYQRQQEQLGKDGAHDGVITAAE